MVKLEKMKVESIIKGYDTIAGAIVFILCFLVFPSMVENQLCTVFYNTGIVVLSIIFSIFFASLSILISAPIDDFIKFMEEGDEKGYTTLISMYKWTLGALFCGLLYSILAYLSTSYRITSQEGLPQDQDRFFLALFLFLFTYGLVGSVLRANDSIQFAKYRSKFVLLKQDSEKGDPLTSN